MAPRKLNNINKKKNKINNKLIWPTAGLCETFSKIKLTL
jgi:hypothetical protein